MLANINLLIFFAVIGLAKALAANKNVEESLEITESRESNAMIESKESFESTQSSAVATDCVIGCPRILDPICAVGETNPKIYKYFHNKCLMESDSCRMGKDWRPTQMVLCLADVDPLLRADCMRACPLIYNPVCASDGKNYEVFANQCIFGIEICLDSGKWLVVRAEHCGL